MMRFIPFALFLLPFLAAGQSAPRLSQFPSAKAFVAAAQAFLDRNPTSPEAPAVAADVYMLSVAARNSRSAHMAMRTLIFRYPQSPQARFVVQNHREAKNYQKFIATILQDPAPEILSRLEGLANAIVLGFHVFGDQFQPDVETALVGMLAARKTTDKDLETALSKGLLERIKHRQETGKDLSTALRQAAAILEMERQQLKPLAHIRKLHGIEESKAARVYEEYYLMQLPPAERRQPDVQIMIIENDLRRHQCGKALLRLQALEQTARDPRLLFWQAYCQARERDYDACGKTLEVIAGLPPKSPWTAAARRYAEALKTREKGIHAHTKLLRELTKTARDELEVFEATLECVDEQGQTTWETYFGFDFPKGVTEVRILAGANRAPLFFFSSTGKTQAIWMEGDSAIRRLAGDLALFPVPRIGITRLPDRTFSLTMNMNFGGKPADLLKAKQELLKSKYLSTDAGAREMLRQAGKANIPLPPRELKDGTVRYVWLRPEPREGRFTTLAFTLNQRGRLVSVGTDRIRLRRIKYGKSGAVELTPPAGPKLPVQEAGSEAEFMMLFAKVFQFLVRLGR